MNWWHQSQKSKHFRSLIVLVVKSLTLVGSWSKDRNWLSGLHPSRRPVYMVSETSRRVMDKEVYYKTVILVSWLLSWVIYYPPVDFSLLTCLVRLPCSSDWNSTESKCRRVKEYTDRYKDSSRIGVEKSSPISHRKKNFPKRKERKTVRRDPRRLSLRKSKQRVEPQKVWYVHRN